MNSDISSRAGLLDLVWDLRDRAFDNPDPWKRVDAESVWQALAEVLEAEEQREGRPDTPSWSEFAAMLLLTADRAEGYASPA